MGISTTFLCVKTREKLSQTLNGSTAKWVALLYSGDVASLASTQREKSWQSKIRGYGASFTKRRLLACASTY